MESDMRFPFIRTTKTAVGALKKQARLLERALDITHAPALERVARTAGYLSWHHVTWCQRETQVFLGPLQPPQDPFDAQPNDPFIRLSVPAGAAGVELLSRAKADGVLVSDDGAFLLFPVEDDDGDDEALCDYAGLSDENCW
jgi:hypothetical protein